MTVDLYRITIPVQATCEFCDQEVPGTIMVQLHGGSLKVCQACYELLQGSLARPYSRVMDKFSMKACGYHITAKMARMRT